MIAHRESLSTLCPSQQQARKLPRAVYYSLLCPQLVAEFVPEVSKHTQHSVAWWVHHDALRNDSQWLKYSLKNFGGEGGLCKSAGVV